MSFPLPGTRRELCVDVSKHNLVEKGGNVNVCVSQALVQTAAALCVPPAAARQATGRGTAETCEPTNRPVDKLRTASALLNHSRQMMD